MSPLMICLFLVSGAVISSAAPVEPSEDWLKLHGQVFNFRKDGQVMSSDDTLKILKELKETGSEWSDNRRMEIVSDLLETSSFKPEKCHIDELDKIEKLMDDYNIMPRTILPYLKAQRVGLSEFCKTQIADSLAKTVESFDGSIKEKMAAISKYISDGDKSKFYSEKLNNKVAAGLLEYLESADGGQEKMRADICYEDNHEASRKKLSKLFHDQLLTLCQDLLEKLGVLNDYQIFTYRAPGSNELVDLWADNQQVCRHIWYTQANLAEVMYQTYIEAHPDAKHTLKSKLHKLIH